MPLKLMYITNDTKVASVAVNAGVDSIFVDLESVGKDERQRGLDTVKSSHFIKDIVSLKKIVGNNELIVRVNSVNLSEKYDFDYKKEINDSINAGADTLILPYFKSIDEVKKFIDIVDGRCKTMPLIETPESVEFIDDILSLNGVDELYIGLNDLSIGYHEKFLFEPLADGTLDELSEKIKAKNIPFGFGGIASLGQGVLHSEKVIIEHYRLGSTMAILSRSFCNVNKIKDINKIEEIFTNGVSAIREFEELIQTFPYDKILNNHQEVINTVNQIVSDNEY